MVHSGALGNGILEVESAKKKMKPRKLNGVFVLTYFIAQ